LEVCLKATVRRLLNHDIGYTCRVTRQAMTVRLPGHHHRRNLFSGAFCIIFWLKHCHPGMLPGLTFSNELISRDVGLHCDFACILNKLLCNPATANQINRMVTAAVSIEQKFVSEALPAPLMDINAETMVQCIKFCADQLLTEPEQPKIC
jgi:ribonucleoside-diphosphate reductase beta chain